MPRNGSGNYSLPPVYLATPGTTVRSEQHNVPLQDLAQAMTDSLPRNGSAPMAGNLSMGGRQITSLGAASAAGHAPRFDQIIPISGTQAYGRSLLNTASAGAALTLLSAVPAGRFITAGSGLVGGGDLTQNRAFAMGIPSPITATSPNAVTATSHSHELSAADSRLIHANAIRAANLPGSLMFGAYAGTGSVLYGQEIDGTLLRPASNNGTQPGTITDGRWVCLGYATPASSTLFIKVSN